MTLQTDIQCVKPSEVGKIYSVLGITGSLMPIGGNPAFRQLYSLTLSYFPGAVLLMAGCGSILCMVCNLYIYTQKDKMNPNVSLDDDKETDPMEDEGFSEGANSTRRHSNAQLSIQY